MNQAFPTPLATCVRLPGFVIDLAREELRTDAGERQDLRPRSFAVLRLLAINAGRLVTKDEIMDKVWDDAVVTEDSLIQCIADIRRAIGDDARCVIRTVPRRGYLLVPDAIAPSAPTLDTSRVGRGPELPGKPSIAVMPFQNITGDAETDYFADGIVEDITTALSRMHGLFVVGRGSSFTYKGRVVDVRQVGRELGVRYVLQGSVRKTENRIRLAGQLIDTSTGVQIAAESFDRDLEEVFLVQDELAKSVIGGIGPKLQQAEIERALKKPTESLDAYDCYLRGLAKIHQRTRTSFEEALSFFGRAIDIDPEFSTSLGLAAWCYSQRKASGWTTDPSADRVQGLNFANRAVETGRNDALALCFGGYALAFLGNEHDRAITLLDEAIVLNANLAATWHCSGVCRAFAGDAETAVEHLRTAAQLSPRDPLILRIDVGMAFAAFVAGRYDESVALAQRSLQMQPNLSAPLRVLVAASALSGDLATARGALERVRQIHPSLDLTNLHELPPWRRPGDSERYAEGFRLAGLPEQIEPIAQ